MTLACRPELSAAVWRKSSYSNQEGGDCVEVADGFPNVVPVRDSKRPDDPALLMPMQSFSTFISAVGQGLLTD